MATVTSCSRNGRVSVLKLNGFASQRSLLVNAALEHLVGGGLVCVGCAAVRHFESMSLCPCLLPRGVFFNPPAPPPSKTKTPKTKKKEEEVKNKIRTKWGIFHGLIHLHIVIGLLWRAKSFICHIIFVITLQRCYLENLATVDHCSNSMESIQHP